MPVIIGERWRKKICAFTVALGIIATCIGLLSLQENILLYVGNTTTSILIGTFLVSALFSTVYFLSLGFELKIRDTKAIQPKKSLKKFGYNNSINTFVFSISTLVLAYTVKFVKIFLDRPCLLGKDTETLFFFGNIYFLFPAVIIVSMLFKVYVCKDRLINKDRTQIVPMALILILPLLLVGIQETLRPKSNSDICKATKIELKEQTPIKFNR